MSGATPPFAQCSREKYRSEAILHGVRCASEGGPPSLLCHANRFRGGYGSREILLSYERCSSAAKAICNGGTAARSQKGQRVVARTITLADGAGGERMHELVRKHVLGKFSEVRPVEIGLNRLDDAAVVDGVAFTTDSYTVTPLFFPGGDIGTLAVSGTINDLAVMGAEPLAISCGMIVEEGLSFEDFDRILSSMAETSRKAGVPIVTGDLKVVERGAAQQLFINTSGIGRRTRALDHNFSVVRKHRQVRDLWLTDGNLATGDVLIVSGTVGDHGIALLSFREGYGFETTVQSDATPLNAMMRKALEVGGLVAAKDLTRGGLANALNEWSEKSVIGLRVRESAIPLTPGVVSACEMLGLDPFEIGNEGKALIAVVPAMAEEVLEALRATPEGAKAAIIGEATDEVKGVVLETVVGGSRPLLSPSGDPIPRIC